MHVTAKSALIKLHPIRRIIFIIISSSSSMKCNDCGAPLCFDFVAASRATTEDVISAPEVVCLKKKKTTILADSLWPVGLTRHTKTQTFLNIRKIWQQVSRLTALTQSVAFVKDGEMKSVLIICRRFFLSEMTEAKFSMSKLTAR